MIAKKYKYKREIKQWDIQSIIPKSENTEEDYFLKMDEEGWELVSVVFIEPRSYVYYWKILRPINELI